MSSSNNGGGIGFGGLLFITFLILKLTHTIDWSWWWVTSPLWIGLALWLALVGVGLLVITIVTVFGK